MFVIEYPYVLLLLGMPWIINWLFQAPAVTTHALKIPHFMAIKQLSSKQLATANNYWQKLLVAIVWFLLCVAAASPKWIGAPLNTPREGRDILLLLDISGSMAIADLKLQGQYAPRLQVVKAVANKFVDSRINDRIGLILFGTKAYLQTPLTFDHKTVKYMINDASVNLAGQKTAIGDAIGLGVKRLLKIASNSKVMVLLTDGANTAGVIEPLKAAAIAKANNIKIYTVGLGATELVVGGMFGSQVVNPSSDLDEESLQQIAKMTNGKFFRAFNVDDLNKVYQEINVLEPTAKATEVFRLETRYFYVPLALAIIISMLWVGLACYWRRREV